MQPSSAAPVLIAGAGPSGLIAALTLLQNHVPVRIIEKQPHHRIGQRGDGVWPRTFEVFHLLRVFEAFEKARPLIPVREYRPGTLEPVKTFWMTPPSDSTPSIPYNSPMILGQPRLEGILRSHIEAFGCSVELGTELEAFEDDGERVTATLVKRRAGEEVTETFEASYIIGADGAKGVTRKQLGLTFLGETRQDFVSVIGDVCVEIEGVDRNHWHIFGDRTADFCMLRPTNEIAPNGFQFLMTTKDYEPKQLIADEKLMFKCMSEMMGRDIKVRKVVVMFEYRPNIRMVDTFGRGRVFVAGDAAHVHSPMGGQGLNTSIQDALNLAWKVSLVYRGLSPASLLDSYTTERLPVIAEMLNVTTAMLNNVRNAPTPEGAMEREKRLNMLGVNYRTSPIVLDEFTPDRAVPVPAYRTLDEGELVAGDRAPDAPGLVLSGPGTNDTETATRLFDVFGATHHTVLVFSHDPLTATGILEVLKKYPAGLSKPVIVLPQGSERAFFEEADVVVDQGGHAYRAYLAVKGKQRVVVVRPDGVAGAIVRGAEGLKAYFDKIFVHE